MENKFSSPSFKPSTLMILTPRNYVKRGFLYSYPLELLRRQITSKIELLVAYAKHPRNHVSESTKMLFMGSSRALINNAFGMVLHFLLCPVDVAAHTTLSIAGIFD